LDLISLIILVAVLIGICIVTKWFVGYMAVPDPLSWIILCVVGLVCLLAFLNAVGLIGHGPVVRFPRY
jgi:hypothetical protein